MKLLQATTLLFYLSVLCSGWIMTSCSAVKAEQQQSIYVSTEQSNNVQQVHASMKVTFTPEDFIHLVSNTGKNCDWMDNCVSVNVLENISETEKLIQTHIAVPWPFKDRDMVVISRVNFDRLTNILTISLTDASDKIAPAKNRVRMTQVFGTWIMQPADSELFELSYIGSANPNGTILKSFALELLKSSTLKTFQNLQAIDDMQYRQVN